MGFAVLVLSYALTVLAMWATNEFDPARFELTLPNIAAVGGAIAAGASWTYERIKSGK